jgi:ABC-2 type transport system ATP-binding protein
VSGTIVRARFKERAAILARVSLIIDRLHKSFGSVVALDGLSFEVPRGQVFGFLGANGAGKTTTMRIVLGVLEANSGTVTWDGIDSRALPRSTWGYLPEERGLYPRMIVLDQLVYFASLYGVPPERARRDALHWLDRFRIPELGERRADELSKGNQQKIQLIAAVLHDPQVLLMDEPFTGLDPVNVALLREAFLELRDQGRTLIFSTHQMETVEALCESIAIVDRGRVVVGGPVREIRRREGRQVVKLAVEGDHRLAWIADVPGARILRPGIDRTEIELDDGVDPDVVLSAALARGARVTHFEVAGASLEQIFIDHVGRPPDEDSHLAPDPEGPPTSSTEPAA